MSDESAKYVIKRRSLDNTKCVAKPEYDDKGYFIAISTAKPDERISIAYIPSKQDDCHTK